MRFLRITLRGHCSAKRYLSAKADDPPVPSLFSKSPADNKELLPRSYMVNGDANILIIWHETEKPTAENVVEGFRAEEFRALIRKGNDDFEEHAKKKMNI